MSFPPAVTLEPALQLGFCDRPVASNAVPVDGGMKDWVARGFPLQRKRPSISSAADFIPRAALPLMGAGVALVLREFTAAALLLRYCRGAEFSDRIFPAKTTAKGAGADLRT